ncbi:MAG: CPBP family intramembrane metalloprotease [Oscillospiraceae bacterium]|nr:CPBP family intramembrane metalloprotease [Oscillospiraceae bacterium]
MDFYSAAGAFYQCVSAASVIPCLLLAAVIVRDRPISSYFSSMGGWRWRVFFKTFAVGLVLVALPLAVSSLLPGKTGPVRFTLGGFLILTLLAPFQGVGEELVFRSYIMQTTSSWFKLPIVGLIVQVIVFAAVHPYNIVGVINIAIAAVIYALICLFTKGLEAGSALHILNNMTEIYMAGFGFGAITSEQTVRDIAIELVAKVLFFLFILYAGRKLHWFDEVKCDDVARFNEKKKK